MIISKRRKRMKEDLKDKEYREAFVSEHIDTGVPFQLKALRNQREWTQVDFEKHTGITQPEISRYENVNYSKFTLATLKKLASAFDIGLMVRFVSFSELTEWELNLKPESLEAESFDKESYFKEKSEVLPTDEPIISKQEEQALGVQKVAPVVYLNITNRKSSLGYKPELEDKEERLAL